MTYEQILTELYRQRLEGELRGELINLSTNVDPTEPFLCRHTNWDYVHDEIEWYNSESLNIRNNPRLARNPIWRDTVATPDGQIISNYGWCIFSKENGKQYNECLEKLRNKIVTKQAVMIYGRPSLQKEWNDGVHAQHDFMCTMYVSVQIRNWVMNYIIHQRSSDAVNGFRNDMQWHHHVSKKLAHDLEFPGRIQLYANFDTIHLYNRDTQLVRDWLEEAAIERHADQYLLPWEEEYGTTV